MPGLRLDSPAKTQSTHHRFHLDSFDSQAGTLGIQFRWPMTHLQVTTLEIWITLDLTTTMGRWCLVTGGQAMTLWADRQLWATDGEAMTLWVRRQP